MSEEVEWVRVFSLISPSCFPNDSHAHCFLMCFPPVVVIYVAGDTRMNITTGFGRGGAPVSGCAQRRVF